MQNASVEATESLEYERASKRTQIRARDELFYLAALFPGTHMGLRAELLLRVPHLTEVVVRTAGPLRAELELELPAWAWLTLGLLHLLTWRRARRVLRYAAPTGVATHITWGVRRNARPAALAGAAARSTTRIA